MPRGLYFLKALFKGLIFGRPYIRRGLCTGGNLRFTIDWASLRWKRNLPFLLCFTSYSRANSKYKSSGGLYSEGHYNEGFFALRFLGTYIWRGSRMEGLIFGILRYQRTSLVSIKYRVGCPFSVYQSRSIKNSCHGMICARNRKLF